MAGLKRASLTVRQMSLHDPPETASACRTEALESSLAVQGLAHGTGSGKLIGVPATLCGYVGGGIVSYALNRTMTFASARPHQEATWRFALVAGVGFLITWALMSLATGPLALPYLPAQIAVTGIVLFWSFTANRLWTFAKAA